MFFSPSLYTYIWKHHEKTKTHNFCQLLINKKSSTFDDKDWTQGLMYLPLSYSPDKMPHFFFFFLDTKSTELAILP